ncbi:MAG: MgtC/SapB family protein [Bacillaceae bacterium]|nr:MgtC/SapB family protein [Bacillaceae bacterium]
MTYRILTAAVLSGLIGFERELKKHSAGFRTHILVGVGACIMMLMSLYGFDDYLNKHENIRFDPARIPSYVISGIGFLGAGTIMVHGMTIRGLTTAASIWTVAGIGLIVGVGMYPEAILATILVLLSLVLLNNIERMVTGRKNKHHIFLTIQQDVKIADILEVFDKLNLSIKKLEVETESVDERNITVELEQDQDLDHEQFIEHISKIPHIKYSFERQS